MNLALLVYIITTVRPTLVGACVFIGIALLMFLFFCAVINEGSSHRKDFTPSKYPTQKRYYILTVLLFFTAGLIPSKDTCYVMLAAYGVESIVTNPEVQKLGGKSLDVLNKAMDEYLQEGTPKAQPVIPTSSEKVEK